MCLLSMLTPKISLLIFLKNHYRLNLFSRSVGNQVSWIPLALNKQYLLYNIPSHVYIFFFSLFFCMLHQCSIAIVTFVVPLCFWISTCIATSTLLMLSKGELLHDVPLILLFFSHSFSCMLCDRGSHHQLFNIIKKGENVDLTVQFLCF